MAATWTAPISWPSEALSRNPNDLAARAIKDAIAKKANGASASAGGWRRRCGGQGG